MNVAAHKAFWSVAESRSPEMNSTLRIVVLGDSGVGKSAFAVRYLTKRYLGEYMTNRDLLYRCSLSYDMEDLTLEILDTSGPYCSLSNTQPEMEYSSEQERVLWADAIIIMYSIVSRASFNVARKTLKNVRNLKPIAISPVILLGNKRDLIHGRQVTVAEGRNLAEELSCQFYEISAAESFVGVGMAFESLIREAQTFRLWHSKTFPRRRRSSLVTVSKMIGAMFGKTNKTAKKKRPSLSL